MPSRQSNQPATVWISGPRSFYLLFWLAAGAIFVVDWLTPLGLAVGIGYVLLLSLTHSAPWPKFPFVAATVCSVLIFFGVFLSPPSGHPIPLVILNRMFSIAACWITAYLVAGRRKGWDLMRASERRLHSIVAATSEIYWRVDPEGRYLEGQWAAYAGLTPEQISGDGYLQAIHPDDREATREALSEAFEKKCPLEIKYRLKRASDGQWRDMAVSGVPVWNEQGDVEEWVGICFDITEKSQAEIALQASNERFGLMLKGVKDYASFMLDTVGHLVSWNSGAEHILGYKEEEAIGQSFSRFFPPEDVASGKPQEELDQAAKTGHVEATGWRVRKDGSRFWAKGVLTALHNDQGQVRGFAKITRDLTEQHRLELLLRSILDHTIDSFVCIDQHGRIETFNQTAERVFGYSQAEVIGKNVSMLMPEPYQSEHDTYIENYLRSGVAKIIGIGREVEALRKDGSTFPVELSVMEFQEEVDGSRHFTGMIRDITERKKLEAQLQQSQKMEAFGQLAGGVAHDFNNLLTVIGGCSEMLLARIPENNPDRRMVDQILHAAERATSLTRQLLAFSRQQFLEPKVLDLNVVVADTEKMLRRLIGEDIQLAAITSPTLSPVKVDPGQIEQVIINLVVNARDAMPQGGKLTIETQNVELDAGYVKTHFEAKPGHYALLAVSDTGCGMTPEVKARIFEPFFTTKGVGKGTGLGLSVVQGIVKQSGGNLEVYSEVGNGTTFKIYLPTVQEQPMSHSTGGQSKPASGTEIILLVEDEEIVRTFSVLALQSFGYHVLQAAGGMDALQVAESHDGKIDLLVTDVVMPEMSGGKLAEAMWSRYPGMKVLFLSGYTEDAVVRHGILQADVAFLQKPFTPTSLARKVREVLDSQ